MTFSQTILNLAIWGLLATGAFFGIRSRRRKKKALYAGEKSDEHQKIT